MAKIIDIKAREILDSRGNPTVKSTIYFDNGVYGDAAVPSGASIGTHEASELRDRDLKRYSGLGVLKAIHNIQTIIKPALIGFDIDKQEEVDRLMIKLDGTANKNKLGANSILAVSLSYARCSAYILKLPLYKYIQKIYSDAKEIKQVIPMFNVINGGLHGCGKFNFQEFLLIPRVGLSFNDALRMGVEIYQSLKRNLKEKNFIYSVGDEGGFTPQFSTNDEVLDFLITTIKESNYSYRKDVYLGLDFAASSFYQNNFYKPTKNGKTLTKNEYINYLVTFARKYHLYTLEDGLYEDDWEGWADLTKQLGDKAAIIGDDLLVTNKKRLQKALSINACNGIIIKPNQIGTLTETLEVIKIARRANFKIVISHRSGETNDDFISDLAVGVGADFAKFGAPARGERVIKYNRLLEIYQELK